MRLRAFDLVIETELPLPGGIEVGTEQPDIRIVRGDCAGSIGPAPLYEVDSTALTFTAPGVAAYRCTFDTIEVVAMPGADPADVAGLLVATALPALLWQRGDAMLHASALCLPGQATALALGGPSGIGKSTVTAQLLARAARLVADDSLRLPQGLAKSVSGLAGGYHLPSSEAREFVPVASAQSLPSAPLGGIVMLGRADGAPEFTRLSPADALIALLASQHRPRVPAVLGLAPFMLQRLADLARTIPVYRWRRGAAVLSDDEFDRLCGLSSPPGHTS